MQGIGLFCLFLTLSGAYAQFSDWGLDEGLIMEMHEHFGDPLKRTLQSVTVRMDYSNPVMDERFPLAEETSNDLLENKALRYYLPSVKSNISDQCKHDIQQIHRAFNVIASKKPRLWSIQLVDSWGKLPDGLFSGNSMPLGMMEGCTGIAVDDHEVVNITEIINVTFNATFNGKYCFVMHGESNPSELQSRIGSPVISGTIPNFLYDGATTYGTCMPDSCSSEDFKVSLDEILPPGHAANMIACHIADEELQWESKDYAFIGVMGFIAFLVVTAAAVDLAINYMEAHELRKGPLCYLLVFSGYTNFSKIFHINTQNTAATIGCLHGIRVLTMTWVLYGHQSSFALNAAENPANVRNLYDGILAQTILGASVSVDTFFFLSGLLVAYSLMRNKDKMDMYGFFMFYVHRILRLMPPIAAVCFFAATVARFFNSGPLGKLVNRIMFDRCNQTWYHDVLFINNLSRKFCIDQTWYISVDMQLYVLVPLIFFPLMYYEKPGLIWLTFMTVFSFVIPTVITHVYQFAIAWPMDDEKELLDYQYILYMGTWSRMSPYFIGLWTGYIIHKTTNKKVTMEIWQVHLGWAISVGIGLLCVYGAYPYNNIGENFVEDRVPTQAVADVFNGFLRGAWGLVLMWVILACHYGYGGIVNSFLAHPSWQPLSRLTYGMFLVSITIQVLVIGSSYGLDDMGHLTIVISTCGTLFLSGIGACILSLLVEGPVLGLEKLLLQRQSDGHQEIAKSKVAVVPSPNNQEQAHIKEKSLPPGYVRHA